MALFLILARNLLNKVWCYGNDKLKKKLGDLELAKMRTGVRRARRKDGIITEA